MSLVYKANLTCYLGHMRCSLYLLLLATVAFPFVFEKKKPGIRHLLVFSETGCKLTCEAGKRTKMLFLAWSSSRIAVELSGNTTREHNGRVKSTRKHKRVAKKDRRNLKLWAEGARKTILKPHIERYTDALERGWRAKRDYLREVCNEFHAQIDWRLEDHKEPDPPLPEYDKFAQRPEEELTDEELLFKRNKIETMNARIGRWLKYRARNLTKPSRMDRSCDPWAILIAKLTGINSPPKACQAFQQYMHEVYEAEIAPAIKARWETSFVTQNDSHELKSKKGPNAPFRLKVARELLSELSEQEQDRLRQRAKQEAQAARDAYMQAMKQGPSKTPESRQKCIDNLGLFMSTILRGVTEYMGLHGVAVFGGPIPAFSGELRTVHCAWGRNHGTPAAMFPQWSRPRFGRDVLDFMREYLQTVFTPIECAEAALPNTEDDSLAGAKFTMSQDLTFADGSDSDSDSDSDGSSDSGSESSSGSGLDSEKKEKAAAKEKEKAVKWKVKKDTVAEKKMQAAVAQMGPSKKRKAPNGEEEEERPSRRRLAALQQQQHLSSATSRSMREWAERNPEAAAVEEAARARRSRPKSKAVVALSAAKGNDAAPAPPRPSARWGGDAATQADGSEDVEMPDASNTEPQDSGAETRSSGAPHPTLTTTPPPLTNDLGVQPPPPPLMNDLGMQLPLLTNNLGALSHRRPRTTWARSLPTNNLGMQPPPPPPTNDMGAQPLPPPPTNDLGTQLSPPPPRRRIPECPAGAASWFRSVYRQISIEDLGDSFNALLEVFVKLERGYRWQQAPEQLPVDGRLVPITKWVASGCGGRGKGGIMGQGCGPELGETARSLQPAWRQQEIGHETRFVRSSYPAATRKSKNNWETLRQPGQNGILSLVAGLYWWGKKAKKEEKQDNLESWAEAVRDLMWMINGLIEAETMELDTEIESDQLRNDSD
ncbi:hypothetical protein B0H16DRAFT_1706246 [Mycena metata]|uniref:Uncharacterized protein n=1 Tax=Mycena metata TaxID=1033252 RepID=A0AAD7DR02_9AGAR|nr:hypothetical protein B0H16DRAFT_1706246 [Mycena metata]